MDPYKALTAALRRLGDEDGMAILIPLPRLHRHGRRLIGWLAGALARRGDPPELVLDDWGDGDIAGGLTACLALCRCETLRGRTAAADVAYHLLECVASEAVVRLGVRGIAGSN